ncbi:C40 family peptidase [Azoarcus olearius]|uniref:Lipoprotein precusor n=1 Tax=Azoarcus sp. (strain BH72) TaxID=418699 RepID=A1K7L5_AZOSB|nr:C40 family peptidase [Azoarcus olearius]CAL94820.1 putative lipoprotein precusor [Azoarcus olearius]
MQIRAPLLALALNLAWIPAALPAEAATSQTSATATAGDDYATAAQELINQGMSYLGIRYRFGGSSPESGLDCSGLVQNVFRNALGLDLPRTAREMSNLGDKIGRQELKPGDLVFFNTMRRAFSHVGIYVGDGQFLHAPSRGGGVRVEDMGTSYWAKRFNGARRLLDDEKATAELPPFPR